MWGRGRSSPAGGKTESRDGSWDQVLLAQQMANALNGAGLQTTYGTQAAEPIGANFAGHVLGGLFASGVVFSVQSRRSSIFRHARPQYQRLAAGGGNADLFGDQSLRILEKPWVGGTTADLMAKDLAYADNAGNAYTYRRGNELIQLRPDWVDIVLSPRILDVAEGGRDAQVGYEKVGYFYYERGNRGVDPAVFLPDEIMHWAPMPDPLATYRGMSWLTPIIREIQGDKLSTEHGISFLERGATPNMVITLPRETTKRQFDLFKSAYEESNQGAENAYRTLLLTSGADATPVGVNMKDLDMAKLRAISETRIAMAGGIHPVVLFSSEGMSGSSLNAGNYNAAKEATADVTFRPLWADWCGSYEVLVRPPAGARLWYDERTVPFLRQDMAKAAATATSEATTITALVREGFTWDSAVAAVMASNWKLLDHTGLFSVQLQPPGTTTPDPGPEADPAPDDDDTTDPATAEDEGDS
jgi:hypothetical protein